MVRRIRRLAPRVVFDAARALAREPVRVRAAQARVLHGFVRVDGDAVARRLRDGLHEMAHAFLRVVVPVVDLAVRARELHRARFVHIARLDAVHAQLRIELVGRIHLLFIRGDVAARLMVADQADALLFRVRGQRGKIEVGVRLRKTEVGAAVAPVAFPAAVPALHEHAAETVGRGEVDVAPDVRRVGGMLGPRVPRPFIQVHLPPHADEFRRVHPRHVAELIRLVQVQFQVRHVQAGRVVRDAQRAPWRRERAVAHDGRADRRRRQLRAQLLAVDLADPHRRVVDQRGLVEGNVRAVVQVERERRVGRADLLERRLFDDLFEAGQFAGRDPPRRRRLRDREFRQLVRDGDVAQLRLVGEFVAEADAVVVNAEDDGQPPVRAALLLDVDAQLAVVVAHVAALAPRLFPRVVMVADALVLERETAVQLGRVGQVEAEARRGDDLAALALDVVGQLAHRVELDVDGEHVARRRRAGQHGLRPSDGRSHVTCKHRGEREGTETHRYTPLRPDATATRQD